jgi:endonuclease/exonuclease/phosphatase family metal-dependent hydrolase
VAIAGSAPPLPPDRPLTVLSWNVQFAAGREQLFFYDGGRAVHVAPDAVRRTLDRIAEVIRATDPDVVLLQEVDRSADRTGRVDQLAELLARAPYPVHLSTPYYRSPYVPFPAHQHMGRMDMHLVALSRYRIDHAIRWQLPMLHESWLRRQFNLRRALLELRLPRGVGQLRLFHTHLSAFSRGDGTLPRQVDVICEHLATADADGAPWLLAGDFNALPPGDDPARLGVDAALYAEARTPVAPLFERWIPAVSIDRHASEPERWRTWLPHGDAVAERAIDHVFVSRDVEVVDVRVLADDHDVSDHLPILVTIRAR